MIPAPSRPDIASRGQIFSWTLFDFANTAFSVVVVTVIFPRYFIGHVAGGQRWLWGLAVSLSMLSAALLAPPLGAAADFSRKRKRYLLMFTLASVTCTALLFTVQQGMIVVGMLLFIIANIGFEGGIVFYDAFLPGLTTRKSYGRVSGYGFAMGYMGSLAILLIVNAMLSWLQRFSCSSRFRCLCSCPNHRWRGPLPPHCFVQGCNAPLERFGSCSLNGSIHPSRGF